MDPLDGLLCGRPIVGKVFDQLHPGVKRGDGDPVVGLYFPGEVDRGLLH